MRTLDTIELLCGQGASSPLLFPPPHSGARCTESGGERKPDDESGCNEIARGGRCDLAICQAENDFANADRPLGWSRQPRHSADAHRREMGAGSFLVN